MSGSALVADLRHRLNELAEKVDKGFPANSELSIDPDGTPHLKLQRAKPPPTDLKAFREEVHARMPERHLLDVLKHVHHWVPYTRHFGPPSGSDPKLSDSVRRYLFTVFGFGCNLGASETARHAPESINRHSLHRINAQHVDADKLEAAIADIINQYRRFELPGCWGSDKVVIADGTQMELRENNLLGERHIRYGGFGGIAYHHISATYIALFSKFIACGVWEAVYILDALLEQESEMEPDILHADTQGQSEPVFGLAHLLGIKLFPRMRNWNDVIFYRPEKGRTYRHIDALFSKSIDWALIETHWQDMMQVVLSIQAGKILPSTLLRKLGSHSRQNRLNRAFRELGRAMRTLFLLRYISEADLRRSIRAETTKVESYNDFLDWIGFGGPVLKSDDPVEQAKQVKYMDLVANVIMLHNVHDLTEHPRRHGGRGLEADPRAPRRAEPVHARSYPPLWTLSARHGGLAASARATNAPDPGRNSGLRARLQKFTRILIRPVVESALRPQGGRGTNKVVAIARVPGGIGRTRRVSRGLTRHAGYVEQDLQMILRDGRIFRGPGSPSYRDSAVVEGDSRDP